MTRRLPAFAKAPIEKRRNGLAPVRDLLIACDWHVGKSWPWRIVVVPQDNPASLDFRVAAGLSCLILSWDEERLHDVAQVVNAVEPLRLIGVHLGGTRIHVYRAHNARNRVEPQMQEHAA